MSEGGFRVEDSPAGGINPWIIAVVVSLATFMEVLDTTIANVALRYIAGSLAASQDQSTWITTSYLVSNAVVLSASGWLAQVLGRKRFYIICLVIFTLSSLLCGLAWNLQSILFFRVLQGLGGGGMVPCSQSILAASFPPEKRGQAFAVFGIAVVVAPVVGPTLGGWLTDTYSWHWCFLINFPVGLVALGLVMTLVQEPKKDEAARRKRLAAGIRIDYVGFILVATALGALEVVLDKGQEDDWFGSSFIIFFTVLSGFCFLALFPWELSRKDPIVDVSLLFRRQFGICFLVMVATGGILIATVQVLPQLLQENYGYNAELAGLSVSPGGIVTMVLMPMVGRLVGVIQPKYLMIVGAAVITYAMVRMTGLTPDINFGWAALARVFVGFGLPFLFLPITTASYDGIPANKTDQASAIINVGRNLGGSLAVALSQTVLQRRIQVHQSRLVESVMPSDHAYQSTLQSLTAFFQSQGSSAYQAGQQAFAYIGQTVQAQASFLAYIDVFYVLALFSATMIPLALLLRPVKLGGGGGAAAH